MQSRYYNPTIGRFLNADAFASTGQGMLGNNMFAYCLNNPVNRIDPTGTVSLWYFVIVDSDMGFIHRAVVDHIGENYWGIRTEYILDNFGRADVVKLDAGAVREVKHAGKDPALRAASAALQAYIYILVNEDVSYLGQSNAFSGTFYIQCGKYSYEVSYQTPFNGVILYTVAEIADYKGEYYRAYVTKALRKKEQAQKMLSISSHSFYATGGNCVGMAAVGLALIMSAVPLYSAEGL